MKTKRNLTVVMTALLGTAVVSSCNVKDDIETNNGAVHFTAGIGQTAVQQGESKTRVAETTWGSGDAIGIFMVGHGTTTLAMSAENKQYITPVGGANFDAAAAGDEIFYPQSGQVDFIAYYPWTAGTTLSNAFDVEIATAQTAVNQPTFDLLYATANNSGSGYTKDTNATTAVALAFDHKLAKLVMNCKGDPSVGTLPADMAVTIAGMNTQNTFDLATGNLGATPTAKAAIAPRKITTATGSDASYDAIILPGTYADGDVTVTYTVGGDAFVWKVPATTFAGGSEYVYEITVTRTGVIFSGSINAWNPVVGGTGTAE